MSEKYLSQKDLIGKTLEHEWNTGKYKGALFQVKFLTDTELRWTGLAGFPKGTSETQKYNMSKIDKEIYQFSWLADDGVSVIITYNFNTMHAFGVVAEHKEQHVLSGPLKLIK